MALRRPLLFLLSVSLLAAAFTACDGDGRSGGADTRPAADAPAGGDTFETCIPPRTPDFFVQTLELVSADGGTRVRLQVEPGEGSTIGETFAFHLHGFALERDGVLTCLTDPAALDYVWGHHNWDETATAQDGLTTYRVRMTFDVSLDGDPVWEDHIAALDASGVGLWEAALPIARCEAEGEGALNGCFQRERVDL